MNQAPALWRWAQLGDVADTALGKMLDRGKGRGLPQVPYLRNVNVQWGRIDIDDLLEMELADEERERFGVERGDLLVCEGGEIGRSAIWQGSPTYMAYQKALHRVRPSANLDPRFLQHQMVYAAQTGAIDALGTGSTIRHLPQQQLRRLPILVPPLNEQRGIVDILEDHLSRLDAADAYLGAAVRRSRSLTAAALSRLARSVDPRATLAGLAISSGYGTSTKCVPDGPGLPVVRIPNLRDGSVDLTDEKRAADPTVDLSTLLLTPGDLLVVRTNGSRDLIGRTAVVQQGIEASFASYLIRYRLDPSRVVPNWVHLMLARPEARRTLEGLAASSAGQYNLSLGKLNGVAIPLPEFGEQSSRMAEYRVGADATDSIGQALTAARERSDSLRRALLAAAFSGRLTGRASDLDLAEELVSV